MNSWAHLLAMVGFLYLSASKFKVSNIKTVEPFGFLVPGDEVHISMLTQFNRIELIIGLNFTALTLKEKLASILNTIKAWEDFPPFQADIALKTEYLSGSATGLMSVNKAIQHLNKILTYLAPDTKYVQRHPCKVIGKNLTMEFFSRIDFNLAKRWSHIDPSWTVASIKTDKGQANTLTNFIDYLNEAGYLMEQETDSIRTILEELADNKFPESLRIEMEDSQCVGEGTGENYRIKSCEKFNAGYYCDLEVILPKSLQTYTSLHPIHYNGIRLKLDEDCLYLQDTISSQIKFANCSLSKDLNPDFPICTLVTLPDDCLKFLTLVDIEKSIENCDFDRHPPPSYSFTT